MKRLRFCQLGLGFSLVVGLLTHHAVSQKRAKYDPLTNRQILEILNAVESDIKEYYWDPKLNGLDVDKIFAEARSKIATAQSQNEGLLYIAAAVDAMKDSHTRFVPPEAPYGLEQGWRAEIIGTKCYITHVQPDGDAETKGLKPGDELVLINRFKITPENFTTIMYGYTVFQQSGFRLLVRSRDGNEREITAMAKVLAGQQYVSHGEILAWFREHRYDSPKDRSLYVQKAGTIFWRLPDFRMQPETLDALISRIRSFSAVVLDLRGNGGGSGVAMTKLLGAFFDHDIQVGKKKKRKGEEPVVAKGRGRKAYGGKLVVLIDRDTASAAEILARVVQLEKRGTVIGDRSAGSVMESQFFSHSLRLSPSSETIYAVEVTDADLVMVDGVRLEGVGVTPDEQTVPSPADLESGRDPVLARAAELTGVQITPEEAAKFFPFHWLEKMPQIN